MLSFQKLTTKVHFLESNFPIMSKGGNWYDLSYRLKKIDHRLRKELWKRFAEASAPFVSSTATCILVMLDFEVRKVAKTAKCMQCAKFGCDKLVSRKL